MNLLTEFVRDHLSDDTARLILDKARWPEVDIELAVNCIESRRKLRGKVREWYEEPELIFPRKLSAEQCSSSLTAAYKADLAERIACAAGKEKGQWRLADLTGGLGVDSWFFSKKASKVLYNEMQPDLCKAARHNFSVLEAGNIDISNIAIDTDTINDVSSFRPDIIYMDPARRGEGGRKVFLIEECTPDILHLEDAIFKISRHLLIKLSPMADINMACSRLGRHCREVHILGTGGECKELLIWMDKDWEGEFSITAAELSERMGDVTFTFRPSEEKSASATIAGPAEMFSEGRFLFEPGKTLMKSGAFNLISERFRIAKFGKSTHYYLTEASATVNMLEGYGKCYRIIGIYPLAKRSIKAVGKEYPKADVTARNLQMDTDTLRKRLGVTSGSGTHIFGLRSDTAGNLLIVTDVKV